MYVVNEEGDRRNGVGVDVLPLSLPLLPQLLVELDKEKRLVLHVREQVAFADKVEHVWTA